MHSETVFLEDEEDFSLLSLSTFQKKVIGQYDYTLIYIIYFSAVDTSAQLDACSNEAHVV